MRRPLRCIIFFSGNLIKSFFDINLFRKLLSKKTKACEPTKFGFIYHQLSLGQKKKSFGSDPSRASPQGGQNKNVGRADMLIV